MILEWILRQAYGSYGHAQKVVETAMQARPCRADVTPYGRCRLAKLSASILVVSCAIFNQSAARRSQASLSVGLRAVLEFSLHISAICRYRSASFIAIGSTKASLLLC